MRARRLLPLMRDKQKSKLGASKESAVQYVLDLHKRRGEFFVLAHYNNLAKTQQK